MIAAEWQTTTLHVTTNAMLKYGQPFTADFRKYPHSCAPESITPARPKADSRALGARMLLARKQR